MVSTRSSSRVRQSASPERPPTSVLLESRTTKNDLPPPLPKEERGVRSDVKKPLEQARLAPFLHVLLSILLVCLAWYTYRTTVAAMDVYKSTGATPLSSAPLSSLYANPVWQFVSKQTSRGMRGIYGHSKVAHPDVERRIEELADALGINRVDFARAIADAVHQFIPRASLSSLARKAKETGGGRIMDVLLGEYAHGVHIPDGVKSKMG